MLNTLMTLVLYLWLLFCNNPVIVDSKIEIRNLYHSFEKSQIIKNERAVFKLQNLTDETIIIESMCVSCPCLRVSTNTRVIHPHDSAKVKLTLNNKGKADNFLYSATLVLSDINEPITLSLIQVRRN